MAGFRRRLVVALSGAVGMRVVWRCVVRLRRRSTTGAETCAVGLHVFCGS